MRRLLLPLLLTPALAACNRAETVREPTRAVTLVQRDYRIAPEHISVPHGRVTFSVRNAAHGPHNFVIRTAGGTRRGRLATLKPGESGKLTVRLRRGTYKMYCGIGHHEQLGEYGTIHVR
jgi:Cupredoxin-like domain